MEGPGTHRRCFGAERAASVPRKDRGPWELHVRPGTAWAWGLSYRAELGKREGQGEKA